MFTVHDPYPQIFSWLCATNNIPDDKHPHAAAAMRRFVSHAREMYYLPMGKRMPYGDGHFRGAYLLAYFPYYIEPIYYTLASDKTAFAQRPNGVMKVAFLGGGPAPESLGLAAYLRDHAPHITTIQGTVFDREKGWDKAQQELIQILAPQYLRKNGHLSLNQKSCNLVKCEECAARCESLLSEIDFIVSQNFLTEIFTDREKAFHTIRNIIVKSKAKGIVFIENAYDDILAFMAELSNRLYTEGLTTQKVIPTETLIRPQVTIPDTLLDNLFIGESGLIPKKKVKFHRMHLRIKR